MPKAEVGAPVLFQGVDADLALLRDIGVEDLRAEIAFRRRLRIGFSPGWLIDPSSGIGMSQGGAELLRWRPTASMSSSSMSML
jgi:hypothetical protein